MIPTSMDLEILAPDHVVVKDQIVDLRAADASGRLGLRPGHEPFLTVLVPCLLMFRTTGGKDLFAAVDGGVLILEGREISLATRDAVVSERLDDVAEVAAEMLEVRRTREKSARAAFAELEASLLRELRKVEPRS